VPAGDLVGLELAEQHAEGGRHAAARRDLGARLVLVGGLRVEFGDAARLGEQPPGLDHRVVPADEHAQCLRLLRAAVRGGAVRLGHLERGDLVVDVVQQLVVDLARGGHLVERGEHLGVRLVAGDGRRCPPFDGCEVPVDRLFEGAGRGTDFGSAWLHSIRHGADGIGIEGLAAQ
jgi:hypothetical protein